MRLEKDGGAFWLAGLGDQWAFWPAPGRQRAGQGSYGVDDLAGTLAQVTTMRPSSSWRTSPIFSRKCRTASRSLSAGHTHGGQVRMLGYAPVVPSRFGSRYVYGHIVERRPQPHRLGGLGCSGLPVRFGAPPEIVMIELAA